MIAVLKRLLQVALIISIDVPERLLSIAFQLAEAHYDAVAILAEAKRENSPTLFMACGHPKFQEKDFGFQDHLSATTWKVPRCFAAARG
jgi:hypothetical protein